ncbi:unnamed protein product [Acanthoscelides obtectus]|uniref:PiggyBac transposable element-derived protein domain-containing protein n=1 Tax=Acanthoscelides obtectus TaxID=200917 RepID=A0A9P0PVQ7_ACAOB|nr:unnamed protein product [Acanthoscelides obtectus]CAK1634030.1 hypothetical protein AOBTE_LOCUS8550 [Acanthoscelides obtectus]
MDNQQVLTPNYFRVSLPAYFTEKQQIFHILLLCYHRTIHVYQTLASDEEELFGGDYSDLDPDYQQPPTSKKRKCLPVVDTSSDWESEDDLPLANLVQTSRDNAIPGGDKRYTWSKTDFQHIRYPKDVFFAGVDGEYSPLAYFEKFFDDDLFEHTKRIFTPH